MKSNIKITFLIALTSCMAYTCASADVIYFKNGFKTEGEVRHTEEGVWVNGGLFSEDEIEKIEKPQAAPQEAQKQSWVDGMKEKLGMKQPVQARPANAPQQKGVARRNDPRAAQAQNANQSPQAALKALEMLTGGKKDDPLSQMMGAYEQRMTTQADVMAEAMRLQQQANQRQMQIQQEIMRAEQGSYPPGNYGNPAAYQVDPSQYEMPPGVVDPSLYYDQYEEESSSSRRSSNNKKRKSSTANRKKDPRNENFGDRSRLGQKIRIGPYGETSWE